MGRFRTRGHAAAVAAIQRFVSTARPPHAVMLVGPPGVGKTTLAIDLAAGLLCRAEDLDSRPCRDCRACRNVERGNHPDVHRIAPEGAGAQVRLPQIHELQSALSLLPMEGPFRVVVVEQAHRMNPDAQNAFLKTLEEPPTGACIVLAVDDESSLLPTVRSRCARLVLGALAARDVGAIVESETGVDAARAAAIARAAQGRPGLALALARDPQTMLVRSRMLRTLLDLAHSDRSARLAAASSLLADGALLASAIEAGRLAPSDPAGAADPSAARADQSAEPVPPPDSPALADSSAATDSPAKRKAPAPAERRRGALAVFEVWRDLTRDVAIAAVGGGREIVNVDLLEEIRDVGKDVAPAELAAFLVRLDDVAVAVEAYANPELALDVLLLRWVTAGRPAVESDAAKPARVQPASAGRRS